MVCGVLGAVGISSATTMNGAGTVQELADGGYVTPVDVAGQSWATILDVQLTSTNWGPTLDNRLRHDAWYEIGLQDWMAAGPLNLVFHGIANYGDNPDVINVYVYDNEPTMGAVLYSGEDASSLLVPNWTAIPATWVGSWSDDDDTVSTNDVVFSMDFSNPALAWVLNGGTFGIGIDPDCAYYFDRLTIETPVPEPASMALLGTGLICLAGLKRRRSK